MPTRAPAPLRLAVTLALTATLGLSACGGDDDATADPPPATATTPSTDPSATPATEPPPTQAPAGETARQFIERWFALEKYAQNTGDTAPLTTLSSACKGCMKANRRIANIYQGGGSITTDGSTALRITRVPSVSGTTVLHVRTRIRPTVIRTGTSTDEQRLPGGVITYEFVLRNKDGWRIADLFNYIES